MSNLDSATAPAAAAVEMGTAERDSTTTSVSALNETQKCKKKKIKKKKNKTQEQQELPPDLDSTAAAETEGQVEANGNEVEEQEATDAAASAMEGTPKCNEEDAKVKVSLMPEKEANTTVVSVSESTPKRKKRRKKKNKMQGQLDSTKGSPSVVAMDITVADKSENGCTDEVGASGHADVNMDPMNGDDPSSAQSKANNADVLLKNKDGNKGNKNCSENSGLLQESSAGRKRRRGKRKWASANGGPGFSSDNGGVDAKHSLHSSANHGLSCTCASCLVEAHEEKIRNIYSPRGSLVRFQRKKLLILDLNGLLADINQDYHNAHLAHAKVRTKLVFRRPYSDDFLRFCFQNFELGIWSSRKRENVKSVVDILMRDLKQYLLFCWDMSYCTVTGCKTIDNKDKPLVLKELKKVWNKDEPNLPWEQGEFSPSNTLLVDDSPYKALCNPPNTAIFPEPYSYLNRSDDYSLGRGGDLRVYLQRIAAADNVQKFVRDNPFGQKSITESDPNWNFYVKIVDKMEKQIVDKVKKKIVDKVEKEIVDKVERSLG
ncbi:uncharacterized protein [Miscanthus floridulus]|uniref:uncharacterized protein isoform X2 n=1 Tax=Miscanthus floridulus TaxID=154761 RepID=UPI00345AFF00